MATTQKNRPVAAYSTLGEDQLLFTALRGRDELGRLSEYQVELLSENGSLRLEDLLGHPLGVRVDATRGEPRYFNGYVTRLAHTGWRGRYATYSATLRHWLWFLTRSTNCRIFQEKSVVDVLKEVFADYPAEYDFGGVGQQPVLPYCVQYRESDFDFVSRLMEDAGIYYFFRQTRENHTMVLTDSYAAHAPVAGHERLRYRASRGEGAVEGGEIHDWCVAGSIESGKQTLADFDFEKATSPESGILVASAALPGDHASAGYARYAYPGGYASRDAGQTLARTAIEAVHAQHPRVIARTAMRALFPGALFNLAEHPREEQNGGYLVVAADYEIAYGGFDLDAPAASAAARAEGPVLRFGCRLEAIAKKHTFRSAQTTARPRVHGPQTAFVVGKAGEEIWTDKYGRVKVQFHWDRSGSRDEKSSCWVRVAQPLAGKRWGTMFLPRIGQEVVVEFLDGDPDRPLVTGCVYNAGMMPPYALPEHATRTTLRSSSSKGGATYNEVRFEDKADAEQLFLYAGRNHDVHVVKDALTHVGNDRHLQVLGSQFAKVAGDRSDAVGGAHKGRIGGNYSLDVARDTHQKSGMNLAISAGQNVDLKGGMNVTLEAGVTLTLKAGGSTIVLGPEGVAINGTMVSIDGSALVKINSGGGAGGASAQAAQPEAPTDPTDADDGKA